MTKLDRIILKELDESANNNRFPVWLADQVYAFTGAMCATGFVSNAGIAIAFEAVEFTVAESIIQTIISCFSTFPINGWIHPGEVLLVKEEALTNPATGDFPVKFDSLDVNGRTRNFTIELNENNLISCGYIFAEQGRLTPQVLTYKICDTLPREELFSSTEYIKKCFAMDDNARKLFNTYSWEHPTVEIYENSNLHPSDYIDIISMAKALAENNSNPRFFGISNTTWRSNISK